MQSRTTVLRHYPGEESNEEYKATIDKSDPSDEEPIAQQQGGLTRKRAYMRQRYEICGQCDEEYAAMDNKEDSCVWHDEELEIDEEADDAWEGWDEPEDTDESRKENPKGFRFPCCNGDGNASGCKSSVHRPDRTKRLRSGAHW